jgi:hypothetical protein
VKINPIILAVAAALPLQLAQALEPAINVQLAATDISGFNSGLVLTGGYEHPLPALHENISIEGELSATLASPEHTYSVMGKSYADELSYYTLAAYIKYTHPVNQQLSLYGRAGVHFENITYKDDFFNSSTTDTGVGRNLGIGADYQLNQKVAFTLGATVLDTDGSNFNSDLKHISAGVKFKL